MQRRTLLTLGVAGATVLAVAGGTLALIQPARRNGQLTEPAQDMLRAVARGVLSSLLPQEPGAQATALAGHLERMQATVAGLPTHLQAEIDELFTIVASAPGRRALVGLSAAWPVATEAEVAAALQDMRMSSLAVRQQAFHALRDLTNASYFADRSTWAALGYPGPRDVSGSAS